MIYAHPHPYRPAPTPVMYDDGRSYYPVACNEPVDPKPRPPSFFAPLPSHDAYDPAVDVPPQWHFHSENDKPQMPPPMAQSPKRPRYKHNPSLEAAHKLFQGPAQALQLTMPKSPVHATFSKPNPNHNLLCNQHLAAHHLFQPQSPGQPRHPLLHAIQPRPVNPVPHPRPGQVTVQQPQQPQPFAPAAALRSQVLRSQLRPTHPPPGAPLMSRFPSPGPPPPTPKTTSPGLSTPRHACLCPAPDNFGGACYPVLSLNGCFSCRFCAKAVGRDDGEGTEVGEEQDEEQE